MPSRATTMASQRIQSAPASDSSTVGVNQIARSIESRRSSSVPPANDESRRGHVSATWRCTRVGVDGEQVAVDDGLELPDGEGLRGVLASRRAASAAVSVGARPRS